ncbi:MAG: tetratricopeptide repeat protein [Saprospiraceae bacterium]|nr:tetratricopeptide repeat protein [Candidatus Defluviibacterium haderslevense]
MTRKETLIKMLDEDPKDSFLMYALGKEFEREGDDPEALIWYEKLIQLNPNYTGVYYHLASLHLRQENIDEARLVLNQGIEICTQEQAHHDLGELKGLLMNLDIE